MNSFLRCIWGLGEGIGCRSEKREVGGEEEKKKKKKPTTLDDLQRLIAWLFPGLCLASAHMGTMVLPGLSFPRHRHLHHGSPAVLAPPITLPVQQTLGEPKWPPLPPRAMPQEQARAILIPQTFLFIRGKSWEVQRKEETSF